MDRNSKKGRGSKSKDDKVKKISRKSRTREDIEYRSIPVDGSSTEGDSKSEDIESDLELKPISTIKRKEFNKSFKEIPLEETDISLTSEVSESEVELGLKKKSIEPEKSDPEQLTDSEITFFSFVNGSNVTDARDFLNEINLEDPKIFDINKMNSDGYSPLHISVQRQDEEMLKLLLSFNNVKLYDTFFYAIKEGDLQMVSTFIDVEISRLSNISIKDLRSLDRKKDLTQRVLKNFLDYKNEMANSEFDEDVSPLSLAAKLGHYELIELFFDAGERLPLMDEINCKSEACKNRGEVLTSYRRLHTYEAICNPVYICFLSRRFASFDPILTSFDLISDLRKISEIEWELKSQYCDLIKNLEEFTGDLMGLTRDDVEVDLVLRQKDGFNGNTREAYPRLVLAVKTRQADYVAHPHTQLILYQEWTKGFDGWKRMSLLRRIIEFSWRCALLPLISLWLFLHSNCWTCGKELNSILSAPVSRFNHSFASYLWFLFLLIAEVNLDSWGDEFDANDKAPPRSSILRIVIEISIFIFVIGQIVATLKQYCFNPRAFFQQWWNVYDVLTHLMFIIAYVFWIIAYVNAPPYELIIHSKLGGREYWNKLNPLLIGEGFFSLAIILSFERIFRSLQLDSTFGPMQIALGKMMKTLFSILIIFLLLITGFAIGMTMLYKSFDSWSSKDENNEFQKQNDGFVTTLGSMESLFYGLFGMAGMNNLDVLTIRHSHKDLYTGQTKTTENHLSTTQAFGKALYAMYHVCATTVLLNTSVAMITGAIGKVFQDVNKQYKHGRTEVWVLYGRDMKVPPPFNTIALFRNPTFLKCFGIGTSNRNYKRGINLDRCCYVDEVNPETDKKLRTAYSVLIRNLVQRYFHAKATINLSEPAKVDHANKIRETVGELREQFRTLSHELTGVKPTRTAWKPILSSVFKFKKNLGNKIKRQS